MELIIQLLSGALGGNLAGSVFKKLSLGTVINSIVGILGGGLGGQILNSLGASGGTASSLDLAGIIYNILGGGVGGGVVMAIIGLIKSLFAKK
ncbi:MAG TPA: hypothetical protein PLG50_11365 [bacterium]|nr:hypothetical protein [bacterium]HQG46246.1 hypothetical protein [bacterium]HQJ65931.1 hypothetical protein [bacterium]